MGVRTGRGHVFTTLHPLAKISGMKRITEEIVRNLPVPERGNVKHNFSGAKLQGLVAPTGFRVCVTSAGRRSFGLKYRAHGLERYYTIGESPTWSVLAAIRESMKLRRRIDKDGDPLGERKENREAATVRELCQRFREEHIESLRPSTRRDYTALVAIIDRELGTQKIKAVERAHIVKMHRARKATPHRANRLLAVASAMFSFAVTEKLRADNPAKGIKRFTEDPRERYLAPEELARLTDALARYPDAAVAKVSEWAGDDAKRARERARRAAEQAVDVVRLCLLTGCRKGEALSARWSQFDFNRGTWTKPSAHTKQKKLHTAPLSDAAIALLKDVHSRAEKRADGELASPYVFRGETADVPLSTIRDHWHAIRTIAKLPDFRLHDTRHNYASLLASGGASLPMIGRLLGHTQAQTTLRYSHLHADPLKKVADAAGAIITGKPGAEIKPIRRDGAA